MESLRAGPVLGSDTFISLMTDDGYDHRAVERRWQEAWADASVYRTPDDAVDPTYVLGMFPYTSGELHMGHVRNYTITDAYARYRRMRGDDVLHPIGWDAFGLPAENAAEERDTNPRDWTRSCIRTMKNQMHDMGFGYDWEREVATCDPEYYRWNQWLFKRFHEAGLVERKAAEINWCPSCETVLADEQVEGDAELCWRCDTPVERRELEQWFLTITDYADELVEDIDQLGGWPDSVRQMQRNWIGRQYGARVSFDVDGHGPVEAFTTRLDTIFGATFFALAPDHPVSKNLAEANDRVRQFLEDEADPDGDEPNGVRTGISATNPANGEKVPVFVADFVLSEVGTGALMGVPGHDERDHAFAEKAGVPIEPVVAPSEHELPDVSEDAFVEDGVLVNSGEYSGLSSEAAREQLTRDIRSADDHVQYRLRDWLISRQRYWGTPIPVVHCPDCGPVMVPEDDLPVELPEFINTTGNPLDAADEWKRTTCPECGGDATRETDTMDTFMDSSWYFLRYISPDLDTAPYDVARANDWMPVDQYVGGIEHAVMHLLYSRFVTKVLADLNLLTHREPFVNLLAQGMVQLEGEAMSKSKGNVVSPQAIVEEHGADTARLFMMQAAQPDREFDWSDQGVRSTRTFLDRLYIQVNEFQNDAESTRKTSTRDEANSKTTPGDSDPAAEYVESEIDATIAIATENFESLTFNIATREAEALARTLRGYREFVDEPNADTVNRGLRVVIKLLSPVAPHIAEELWEHLGEEEFVVDAVWPDPDGDVADADDRRQLVDNTREDVRDIVDVADIEDPQRIDIVIAPAWKYRALEIAIESDVPNVVSAIMEDDEIRRHGDEAAAFGQDLQAEREALSTGLTPEREYEVLTQAAWLLKREFGADVRVLTADRAADDIVNKAEPGRPAIDIAE